ncbi:MAG: hypothetical protein ACE5I1_09320, partial [bacterium]
VKIAIGGFFEVFFFNNWPALYVIPSGIFPVASIRLSIKFGLVQGKVAVQAVIFLTLNPDDTHNSVLKSSQKYLKF